VLEITTDLAINKKVLVVVLFAGKTLDKSLPYFQKFVNQKSSEKKEIKPKEN